MAEVIEVDFRAKTDQAEANLTDVVNILGEIKEGLKQNTTEIKEQGEQVEKNTKSVSKLAQGFKGVGLALKAAGIGLAIKAFDALASALGENQKFADGLSKVFLTVSTVIGELIETLTPLVDVFTNVGSAVKALVTGDFDALSNIGSDLVQNFKDLGNGAIEFAKSLPEVVTNSSDLADEIVRLRNETELASARAEQLVFIYQTQAEELRQVRDDVRLTVRERILANEELGKVLEEQLNVELSLRQKRLELAQKELEINPRSIEAQRAVIEAETELLDVRERITGQRSEFLTNQAALEQELIEANESIKKISTRSLNDAVNTKELQTERTLALNQKQLDSETALANAREKIAKKEKEREEAAAEQRLVLASTTFNSLIALNNAFAGQTEEGQRRAFNTNKALAISESIVSTYLSATKAYASQLSIPTPDAPVRASLAAAAAVAAGLANIAVISQQKFEPNSAGGGGFAGGNGSGAVGSFSQFQGANTPVISAIPNFNPNQQPPIGSNNNGIRAYVVENDITSSQSRQKILERKSRL